MEISLDGLDVYLREIEDLFGKDFLSSTGLASVLSSGSQLQTKGHPLQRWYYALNQDVILSKKSGLLRLSEMSLRLLKLLCDLKKLLSVPGLDRILRALKQANLFYSSVFEASVAALYYTAGLEVEIMEESSISGVTSNDLCVRTNGGPVYVECKSLDDISRTEMKYWDQVVSRMRKSLRRNRRSWAVTIYSNSRIDGRMMEKVCSQVATDVKLGNKAPRKIGDTVRVEYSELCEWGKEKALPMVVQATSQSPIGLVEAEVRANKAGVGYYRNPIVIRIFPFDESDITGRVLSELRKARKQIPKEGPGIVHIEVPAKVGPKLLSLVDRAYDSVFTSLNRNTERINAVVITGIIFQRDQHLPIVQDHYIIPNLHTRKELPPGFTVPGARDWLPSGVVNDDEGTVDFWVTVPNIWNPNLPLNLFFWASRDGKRQLRIWRTWDEIIRFDVFTPSLGRVCALGHKRDVEPGKRYYVAATWSKKQRRVALYMDGHKVAQTDINLP